MRLPQTYRLSTGLPRTQTIGIFSPLLLLLRSRTKIARFLVASGKPSSSLSLPCLRDRSSECYVGWYVAVACSLGLRLCYQLNPLELRAWCLDLFKFLHVWKIDTVTSSPCSRGEVCATSVRIQSHLSPNHLLLRFEIAACFSSSTGLFDTSTTRPSSWSPWLYFNIAQSRLALIRSPAQARILQRQHLTLLIIPLRRCANSVALQYDDLSAIPAHLSLGGSNHLHTSQATLVQQEAMSLKVFKSTSADSGSSTVCPMLTRWLRSRQWWLNSIEWNMECEWSSLDPRSQVPPGIHGS
jgi:hypothetical protein